MTVTTPFHVARNTVRYLQIENMQFINFKSNTSE